jgi:hypothetical protein
MAAAMMLSRGLAESHERDRREVQRYYDEVAEAKRAAAARKAAGPQLLTRADRSIPLAATVQGVDPDDPRSITKKMGLPKTDPARLAAQKERLEASSKPVGKTLAAVASGNVVGSGAGTGGGELVPKVLPKAGQPAAADPPSKLSRFFGRKKGAAADVKKK